MKEKKKLEDAHTQEAMQQIKEKEYYQMFVNKGKKTTLVGISFDTHKRCVRNWIAEDV